MGKRKTRHRDGQWTNRITLIGATVVVLLLALTLHIRGLDLQKKDLEYHDKELILESQVAAESQEAEELAQEQIYVQTKEYIEKTAKEKLGLVYPDEILLKPSN
ncbi:MAG: septum formation initiator family protein [bacterium]|nr:septum formation initiator family protein [bacterium]